MSVSVTINREDIARIKSYFLLMGKEVPLATSRAINRTLTAVNTEASIQVRKVYNLTATRIKKNFKTSKATMNNLNAAWRSKGRPVGLLQFGARQTKKGVSVKVMASSARTVVYGAFIQIPKMTLTGRAIMTGPQVFWREKKGGQLVDRYNIHRLEGPRIEDALAKPDVQKALQKTADDTLSKRLDAEANYILSRAGK